MTGSFGKIVAIAFPTLAAIVLPGPLCAEPGPVAAKVEATLPTATGQPRQFAFDGNLDTGYVSSRNASENDHFSLVLEKPVSATLVLAVTGRPNGEDELEAGVLEVSADGRSFEPFAKFEDGTARGDLRGREVRALRIRPEFATGHPLAVRELTLVSDPPVTRFRYPVEFIADVADAPEMKPWAENVARVCERTYAMINDELKTAGDRPPHWVVMSLKKSYDGVAMAGGGRITGSVRYFKEHPDDVGAMVHESVHIVQRYPGNSNPSWLVEGVSDYIRFFKFEPAKLGRIDARRAHYNQSYRVSAAFLAYLTDTYDKQIVPKLNRIMRAEKYDAKVFEEWTGKTLPALDDEWRATLSRK
ncbi:MAG: basic secretory protein-like protein [Isosphaeraceae bacterium]|nr:basic secretory protein-like protein [Isosphaeraceae bacterium]